MDIKSGLIDSIGNTPLIRIETLSRETGCEILGKAEFMNPGGSVKDRAAWWMVREAEKSGALKPGGTVVEGTAGNTGILKVARRTRPIMRASGAWWRAGR